MLLTYVDETGVERCVGYLFNFKGRGIFAPGYHYECTDAQAKAHNAALSAAEIEGLDKLCEVGQYGTFYFVHGQVQTWNGDVVCSCPAVNGRVITFTRGDKVFRGRLCKDADCFNFRRIK